MTTFIEEVIMGTYRQPSYKFKIPNESTKIIPRTQVKSKNITVLSPIPSKNYKLTHDINDDLSGAEFDYNYEPKRFNNFDEIFTYEKVLGRGGFGEVHLIRSKQTGKPFALKILLHPDPSILNEEIGALKKISAYPFCDKNIVCYYDTFIIEKYNDNTGQMEDTFAILSEYIDGMDLAKAVDKDGPFTEKEIIILAKWLISTVAELHRMGYVHRDIKENNIMLSSDGKLKLIDFGLSCLTQDGLDEDGRLCYANISGTPGYIAPEIYDGTFQVDLPKYYRTADVYAIGMTLYNLLEDRLAYDEDTRPGREGYPIGEFISFKKTKNQCLKKLIQEMVDKNPDNRPTIFEAQRQIEKC
jgi:serine/threonine protein kinase